jgi:hypothetical protein
MVVMPIHHTPRRNYTGTDSFTYTVNDGTGCVQATISLVVQNQSNNNNNVTNTSPSTSVVNWDIFAPQIGITLQPQVLTSQEEETNLAVLTGLVVRKI